MASVGVGGGRAFDLAARGIEVGRAGGFFPVAGGCCERLSLGWRARSRGADRHRPPGAGKSAVMGRLATLSDPDYRKAAMQAGVMPSMGEGTVPPEGIIDVAIHAKGKTLDDCARALARRIGAPDRQGGRGRRRSAGGGDRKDRSPPDHRDRWPGRGGERTGTEHRRPV